MHKVLKCNGKKKEAVKVALMLQFIYALHFSLVTKTQEGICRGYSRVHFEILRDVTKVGHHDLFRCSGAFPLRLR